MGVFLKTFFPFKMLHFSHYYLLTSVLLATPTHSFPETSHLSHSLWPIHVRLSLSSPLSSLRGDSLFSCFQLLSQCLFLHLQLRTPARVSCSDDSLSLPPGPSSSLQPRNTDRDRIFRTIVKLATCFQWAIRFPPIFCLMLLTLQQKLDIF